MISTELRPEQYPYLVHQLDKPPKDLYYAGALPPSSEYKYLCVIGSRHYSSYGKEACHKLIAGLKNYPIVIVSGLAIGIDSIAHEAALKTGLKTLSIPGSGLSRETLYPASHYQLAERIIDAGGTMLSPFSPEQKSTLWTFPVRNELMAGCSQATLIIEGKENSGTLLTAKAALGFGRDVMIVPGSIFSPHSRGPHHLFGEGAIPVFSSEDILKTLGFDVNRDVQKTKPTFNIELLPLSNNEKSIIRELQHAPLNSSDLIEKMSLSATEVSMLLTQLELQGIVVQHDGVYRIINV